MWILEKLGIPVGRFDTARIEFVAAWPGWFIWLCLAACALAGVGDAEISNGTQTSSKPNALMTAPPDVLPGDCL